MLSESQKNQFYSEGYLVVPDVVPGELCDAVIDTMLDHAGIDLDNEATWYERDREEHGIIPLHHDQALWDLRQHPAVHSVFADLYGVKDLLVSNDRVSFKPRVSEQTRLWRRERVHWDCDPRLDDPFRMQGLVYLTDTGTDQGAFCCVPSIYRNLKAYIAAHESDENWRFPQVDDADLIRVAGPKGSLVVFHRHMPHTSDLNRSGRHRFVQYITMRPPVDNLREVAVREWRERLLPDWALTQPVSGGKTREEGPPPVLTDLGRKLVGLDSW